jgi:hypothetical protein
LKEEPQKIIPQGLKPSLFCGIYGTAKAVPFQNIDLFRVSLRFPHQTIDNYCEVSDVFLQTTKPAGNK